MADTTTSMEPVDKAHYQPVVMSTEGWPLSALIARYALYSASVEQCYCLRILSTFEILLERRAERRLHRVSAAEQRH